MNSQVKLLVGVAVLLAAGLFGSALAGASGTRERTIGPATTENGSSVANHARPNVTRTQLGAARARAVGAAPRSHETEAVEVRDADDEPEAKDDDPPDVEDDPVAENAQADDDDQGEQESTTERAADDDQGENEDVDDESNANDDTGPVQQEDEHDDD